MQLRIYSIILICSHISQVYAVQVAEDSVKSYMWGLIKINSTQKILYHPREFHHPITFMPLELRYGLSFTGGAGGYGQNMPTNWIKYDENFGGSHYNAGKKIA